MLKAVCVIALCALSVPAGAAEWLYMSGTDPENGRDAYFYFGAPDGAGPLFGFVCLPARPYAGVAVQFQQKVDGEYQVAVQIDNKPSETIRMVAGGIPGMIVSKTLDVVQRKMAEVGDGSFARVSVTKGGRPMSRAIYSLTNMDNLRDFRRKCGPIVG